MKDMKSMKFNALSKDVAVQFRGALGDLRKLAKCFFKASFAER